MPVARLFHRADVPMRPPCPALADHVHCYVGLDRTATAVVRRRLTALGSVVLFIDLDRVLRRGVAGYPEPAAVSPVSGLSDRPLLYEHVGPDRGILVELTPLGAMALFGMPLKEIANASVGLGDLIGERARRLAERLADLTSWSARFRLLDDQLTRWVHEGPALAPQLCAAWRQLTGSVGQTRISALADQVGWSRQHLNSRFHHQIGQSPKKVARIARFQHALRLAVAPNPPRWAHIATVCGYTDQSHLNLDFRALAGCSPGELLGSVNERGDVYLSSQVFT